MKSERTRLLVLAAILAVVGSYALIQYLSQGGLSGELTARSELQYEPHDLPQLATGPLPTDPANEDGSQRNPFTYGPRPTPTRNLTPQPTRPPPPTRPPVTPRPTPTLCAGCPGPTPSFDRVYIGHLGPNRLPVAVFRNGDKVEVAIPGLTIGDKFILRKVDLESVVIGFVGFPEEVSTRVPLAEK